MEARRRLGARRAHAAVDGPARHAGDRLDVRAEKTWLYKTWSLGLYLDIQNVYNHTNVEATQYDYRYQDSVPISGIPILPTLGIRGQW